MSLQLAFWDDACAEALSDERLLDAMARFEAALARASVASGLVPADAARTITEVAGRATFDAASLARASRRSATLAIPFVRSLTEQVAAVSADAARYVHLGATSQDVIDTGAVLCLAEGSKRVATLARRLGDAAAALARKHATTPMVSRTLLQPAIPVPFGWKVAVWLGGLTRDLRSFESAAASACQLQFGGAGGTLSAYGKEGETIAASLARELGLPRAGITWHGARDGYARLGAEAAILAGAAGKVARDVSLMMQPEVGELFEPSGAGRGGSSAMPHKRNPVNCVAALEAAQRAPALAATLLAQLAPEHERGLGQWQSQFYTLRDLLCATASALGAMAEVLEGLTVDETAMRRNLDRTAGLVYSEAVSMRLAQTLGKQAAHALTEKLCERAVREGTSLEAALRGDAQASAALAAQDIPKIFSPESCFGDAPAMIARALQDWARIRAS